MSSDTLMSLFKEKGLNGTVCSNPIDHIRVENLTKVIIITPYEITEEDLKKLFSVYIKSLVVVQYSTYELENIVRMLNWVRREYDDLFNVDFPEKIYNLTHHDFQSYVLIDFLFLNILG